jgi:glycosyltransferase involved in cell wall biosynthesis
MSETKISAVIITLNEEKNIARFINSLRDAVDALVVVDSYFSDITGKICRISVFDNFLKYTKARELYKK